MLGEVGLLGVEDVGREEFTNRHILRTENMPEVSEVACRGKLSDFAGRTEVNHIQTEGGTGRKKVSDHIIL